MPSFELLYGNYWFTVNVEDFVIEITNDGSVCALCLSTYESEWILGDAFMRGWYNIHDHTNAKIGFHTLDASVKSKPTESTSTPTETLPYVEVNTTFLIFGIDAVTFLITVSLAVIITGVVVIVVIFCFVELMTRALRSQTAGKGSKLTAHYKDSGEESISLVILE